MAGCQCSRFIPCHVGYRFLFFIWLTERLLDKFSKFFLSCFVINMMFFVCVLVLCFLSIVHYVFLMCSVLSCCFVLLCVCFSFVCALFVFVLALF